LALVLGFSLANGQGVKVPKVLDKILKDLEFSVVETRVLLDSGYGDSEWMKGLLIPAGVLVNSKPGTYVAGEKFSVAMTLIEKDWPSNWLVVPLGRRILKSIDYMNEWSEGVAKFQAFKFTYRIHPFPWYESLLPNVGPFQGYVLAFWHPATGEWTTSESYLKDEGAGEFYTYVRERVDAAEKLKLAQKIEKICSKYKDNNNGTVTDVTTGLTWTQNRLTVMAWDQAIAACKKLRLGGFEDWRLPTCKELSTIMDAKSKMIIDTPDSRFFKKGEGLASNLRYWTIEEKGRVKLPYGGPYVLWVWAWHWGGGLTGVDARDGNTCGVLCVRGNILKTKVDESILIVVEETSLMTRPALSEVIAVVPKGTTVEALDKDSNPYWTKVKLPSGEVGWIDNKVLEIKI